MYFFTSYVLCSWQHWLTWPCACDFFLFTSWCARVICSIWLRPFLQSSCQVWRDRWRCGNSSSNIGNRSSPSSIVTATNTHTHTYDKRGILFKDTLSFLYKKNSDKNFFLRNQHIYIKINVSYKIICVEFKRKKQHNIGFPAFKLPTTTTNLLWLTH